MHIMKGRKPTPTALKIVRGNPGKRALPKDEPTPPAGADAPDWLSPLAAEHWPLIAKGLEDARVLTVMDAPALALYCEAFVRWKHANEQLVKSGMVVKAPSGYLIQSPYLSIANKAFDQMTKMLIEFGMTPSSRSRVTKVKLDKDKNPFADLVKRPGSRTALQPKPKVDPSSID
ncbi:phage terminase small subunit P27 family [Ralstonia solanacearum]|uniref:phage terminase small subunit P27 family n=1 Tax=Ralstonia solanacearum TaxID=305 RepID=UPI0035EA7854